VTISPAPPLGDAKTDRSATEEAERHRQLAAVETLMTQRPA
jgi:hypothetical protein